MNRPHNIQFLYLVALALTGINAAAYFGWFELPVLGRATLTLAMLVCTPFWLISELHFQFVRRRHLRDQLIAAEQQLRGLKQR